MSSASLSVTLASSATAVPARSVTIPYTAAGGPGQLPLTGAQTFVVDLTMFGGASIKGIVIVMDTVDVDGVAVSTPVTLRRVVNSVTINEPLGPGDVFALSNLSASGTTGTTALTIVSTANALLHVAVLG